MKEYGHKIVNAIYIGLLLILVYTSSYVYSLHGWKGHGQIFIYYLVIFVGILGLSIALFLRKEIKTNLLSLLISFGVALYLADAFLFLSGIVPAPHIKNHVVQQAEVDGVFYDTRSRHEVLLDMREENADIWPVVFPKLWIKDAGIKHGEEDIFPLGGISNSKHLYCNESGTYVTYDSDRFGFNNPDNIHEKEVDIIIVGDSFVEGACVRHDESIVGRLLEDNHIALNFGKGGNGPLLTFAVFKEYVEKIRPKYVVWSFYDNDHKDFQGEKSSRLLTKYFNSDFSQDLIGRQKEIDSALKFYITDAMGKVDGSSFARVLRLWHLRFIVRDRLFVSRNSEAYVLNNNTEEIYEVIAKANDIVQLWGGELIFVYLPSRESLISGGDTQELMMTKLLMSKLSKNKDIAIIDMYDSFLKLSENASEFFPFGLEHHYNSKGYEYISKMLHENLLEDRAEQVSKL